MSKEICKFVLAVEQALLNQSITKSEFARFSNRTPQALSSCFSWAKSEASGGRANDDTTVSMKALATMLGALLPRVSPHTEGEHLVNLFLEAAQAQIIRSVAEEAGGAQPDTLAPMGSVRYRAEMTERYLLGAVEASDEVSEVWVFGRSPVALTSHPLLPCVVANVVNGLKRRPHVFVVREASQLSPIDLLRAHVEEELRSNNSENPGTEAARLVVGHVEPYEPLCAGHPLTYSFVEHRDLRIRCFARVRRTRDEITAFELQPEDFGDLERIRSIAKRALLNAAPAKG